MKMEMRKYAVTLLAIGALALWWAALIDYVLTRSDYLIYVGYEVMLAIAILPLINMKRERFFLMKA